MVDEESANNLIDSLNKISNSLMLKSMMDYRDRVADKISAVLTSEAKKAVWDLCDGFNNNASITKELSKGKSTISEHIKSMVEDKIIFEIQKGKEKYLISVDSLIDLLIKTNIPL